jgi:hypothetical protein
MPAFDDLTGRVFGRLTVVSRATNAGPKVRWSCACTCGREPIVHATALRIGHTRSCGCLKVDQPAALTHGHSTDQTLTPTYLTWASMIQRCQNPKNPSFPRYGGRGIKVCDAWLKFDGFLLDMGERPQGLTLERINNDGGYEPGNCKWATYKTQNNNRRVNHLLAHKGQTFTLQAWAERTGLKATTIRRRLKMGWTVARALESPTGRRRASNDR